MLTGNQADSIVRDCIRATSPNFGGQIAAEKKIRQCGIVSKLLRHDLIDRIVNSGDGVARFNHEIDPEHFASVTVNTKVSELRDMVQDGATPATPV